MLFSKQSARHQELRKAVKELYHNPDLAINGLPPLLNTRHGVREIFRQAKHTKNSWMILLGMSSGGHGSGPDWQPYADMIRPLLRTNNYKKGIFATTTLTALRDHKKSTCRSINAFLDSVNLKKISTDRLDMLVASLTTDSHYASHCSTSTIEILSRLISRGDRTGLPEGVAARLYQLSADEERQQEYLNKPDEVLAMVDLRERAKARLQQAFSFHRAINRKAIKAPFQSTDVSNIEYWANLALEDFDDQTQASSADQISLETLNDRLKSSVFAGDKKSLQAIASALASYDPSDKPLLEIITLLESALQDIRFQDIRVDLGYALQKITGVPQPLDHYWN